MWHLRNETFALPATFVIGKSNVGTKPHLLDGSLIHTDLESFDSNPGGPRRPIALTMAESVSEGHH